MHCFKSFALATVLVCSAAAQTTPPAHTAPAHKSSPPAKPAAAATAHDASEPVITVENLCPAPKPGAECKTVITKAEFEKLLNAIRPNLPASARMQIAQKYVELLTFADKGQQAGLDKSPEFKEQLELMRMQGLAGAYNHYLQEKYAKASDAEIEKYYQENKASYEEVTLRRIYIPKPGTAGEKKPPLDEAATKALAEKIQARAAAGEDFDKLQQEAFAAANPEAPKDSAPPTSMGPRRRGQLPAQQESTIFALDAGKVTPVIDEPAGFFIYKVESKQVMPLEKVRSQIARQLEEQKMRDAIQQTVSSVKPTFNDKYFKVPAEGEPAAGPAPPKSLENVPAPNSKAPTPAAPPSPHSK